MGSFYETQFEIWPGFGQFRLHEFRVHFITILSKIYFTLIKQAN